jgi:hypothetical protein
MESVDGDWYYSMVGGARGDAVVVVEGRAEIFLIRVRV